MKKCSYFTTRTTKTQQQTFKDTLILKALKSNSINPIDAVVKNCGDTRRLKTINVVFGKFGT